jgi:MoxR-like ATPase
MGYPETQAQEEQIVETRSQHFITFPPATRKLAVEFVRELRESDRLERLPSVRASIGLYERAQTNALLKKKSQVSWQDVQEVLVSVLSHRIKLKPSAQYLQTPQELIEEKIRQFAQQHGLKSETDEGDVP